MSEQAVPALLGVVGLVVAFVIYGVITKLKVSDPKVENSHWSHGVYAS